MGRSRAIRFTVEMQIVKGYTTPCEYPVKHCGRASVAGLEKFVADYNWSLAPGGVNEHIGTSGICTSAVLKDHGTVVATWQAVN